MDKLHVARLEINEIDKEMAQLFCRRMNAVRQVSEHKRQNGLPTLDSAREEELIRKNSEYVTDAELRPYYVKFLRDTMNVSRLFQDKLAEGERVAFCGVEGAYAHAAAKKIFKTVRTVSYPDFASAYHSVVDGECDCAVLPIENSTAGEVSQVMDMLFSGPLYVTGLYDLTVKHCLMAAKDADMSTVKEVISHPQALAQCADFISSHSLQKKEFENTAMAAQYVAEKGDTSLAAIASEETAELYGLKILQSGINESAVNTTRFAVVSRACTDDGKNADKHTILMFTVRNEAGSLARAIYMIGSHGYNMRCLRSRPMKELLWQYYFYVELEGSVENENGKSMLRDLQTFCDKLKVLGTFHSPKDIS